jgi:hypothetical protein
MAAIVTMFNHLCSRGNDTLWIFLHYLTTTMTSLQSHERDTTYVKNLTKMLPGAEELLNDYIGIPEDKQLEHMLKVVSSYSFVWNDA